MDRAIMLKGRDMTEFCNEAIGIDEMKFLNMMERWTLYDALMTCRGTFGADVREEILNLYSSEMHQKYKYISEERLIKKNMDVLNLDEAILLKLYEAVDKGLAVTVRLEGEITLNRILPSKIYLEEEEGIWYLEHVRGGEPFAIDLKKIREVIILRDLNRMQPRDIQSREDKRKMQRVKIRVFDEKNSRERAIGFLSSKYIIDEEVSYGYSDMTANIINMNAFKKWVMEMTPQVLILEPAELKQQFIEMADSWEKNYLAGI